MDRRDFLKRTTAMAAIAGTGSATALAQAASPAAPAAQAARAAADYRRPLVLIELKGGNDGLNTLVPYADPAYAALRPKLGIARDDVLQLSDRAGLHPSMAPLLPLWQARELAVLQGVGYPAPNLSHFRSIEIWDTASGSQDYLQQGWLARTFASAPTPAAFAADGVIIGTHDLGPLAGGGTRAIALASTERFLQEARLATVPGPARTPALAHILKVEGDVVQAASRLDHRHEFATAFPSTGFGNAIRTAAQVLANPSGVAVVRVTLAGFDTHTGQRATQARLLGELAEGIAALRAALTEIDRWNDTLVLTYAEFGRRARENLSQGTDHGTASVHFATGGRVAGGLYGEAPSLVDLDGEGNLRHTLDFRGVYATVLERWWHVPSRAMLGGRFTPEPFLRT